ncbi:kinesin-domain-containing protein [Apiospora arundinis]
MAKGDLVDEIQWLGIPDPKKQSSLHSGEVPPPSWHGAFERVFDTSATNADVFDEVKPVISSAFSGRSVCVFAYGQSGSGKTYTLGTAAATVSLEEGGVIPRSMDMLADFIEKRKDTWMYSVEAEFLEIYNEDVFDLLPEKRTKAAIKYNSEYYFADSRHVELTHEGALDMNMVQSVLQGAADKRKVGATVKNNQSSRSHSLLTLRITGKLRGGTADGQEQVTHGVLNLVDLAGSEKYTNTAASSTSKEGININNSLMVLRKVIGSMADPKTKHTGYRESTLTKLLEPCLGQGCRVIMFNLVFFRGVKHPVICQTVRTPQTKVDAWRCSQTPYWSKWLGPEDAPRFEHSQAIGNERPIRHCVPPIWGHQFAQNSDEPVLECPQGD